MKLIIDIPEECLKNISNAFEFGEDITKRTIDIILDSITKSTPIPDNVPTVDVLNKIRAEIEQKIEQERFARSVFRGEEKDAVKAEQCTGSIFAYNNVIRLIDKYKGDGWDTEPCDGCCGNHSGYEPCEDAISRQAVNTLVDELARAISDERCYLPQRGRSTATIMQDILDLPPVTQKSGKWIMSDDGLYRPICDKCGAHPWKGYIPTVEEATEVFKYCPNCGCRMVEPQESEDKE